MIRSMTAFARSERRGEWGQLTWELRSVNHRYLEVSLRFPEELRSLEQVVRERVSARIRRGKVECNLRFRPDPAATPEIVLNGEYLDRLLQACGGVEGRLPRAAPVNPVDLLRWPGVVSEAERDLGAVMEEALAGLDAALAEMVATREREGEQIAGWLLSRCEAIDTQAVEVRERLPAIRDRLRERMLSRLAEIAVEADPGRLEQELALQAQKMDVDEELDRLSGHVAEVRRVLTRDEPVGRRLDFLMQELNREANTLGSKSVDADTTRAAVELKVLIEQMREQVQNAE
ncbi:MAG: YicC/YloC family endoribonuclease [Gammaproteobacteria bacterium]